MTTLQFAVTMGLLVAMALAVVLAARDRSHQPIAALLLGWAAGNLAVLALQVLVVGPAVLAAGGDPAQGIAPRVPLTGWDRAAAHVGHAIELGSSAWLAVCALWVFGAQRWRFVTFAWPPMFWFWAVAFFVVSYPETRPLHHLGYLLADMLAVAAGAAAAVGWFRRRSKGEGMPEPQKCMLLVLGMVALAIVGAHTVPGYFAGGDRAQAAYGVMYAMLIVYQGGSLWMSKMWSS